jgi:mono/diheme cytochrome c family protein
MARFRLRSSVLLGVIIVALAISAPIFVIAQTATPQPGASPGAAGDAQLIQEGEQIYGETCIHCHQAGGVGVPNSVPALAGNPFVTMPDPQRVVQRVLFGREKMPAFADTYNDEQIAAVVSYIRNTWGNQASTVSPAYVAEVRAAGAGGSPVASPMASPAVTPVASTGG